MADFLRASPDLSLPFSIWDNLVNRACRIIDPHITKAGGWPCPISIHYLIIG